MVEVDLSPEAVSRIKAIVKDALRELVNENVKSKTDEWVSTEEAAALLGITPKHLRTIRNRFEYVRVGGKRGGLKFKKENLFKCYIATSTTF